MPLDSAPQDIIAACRHPTSLPGDVRQVLDGLLDDWCIDEGSYIALNLFAPREPISALIAKHRTKVVEADWDLAGPLPATLYADRRRIAPAVLDLAEAAIASLPQQVFDGLAQFSLGWLRRDLEGLAEVFSMWVHEDETTGGCMKHIRDRRRISSSGEVWRRTARQIRSPAFIARYVKGREESLHRRAMANRILDRAQRASRLSGAAFEAYASELAAQREADRVAGLQRLRADLEKAGKDTVAARKRTRQRRSALKRALAVAAAIVSDDAIRAFVRGGAVRLPGQTLDLAVKLAARPTDRGHGCLAVYVTAPDSREVLAHLCTYIEDTPALDQLAAFALAMQAGEEAQIIADANITALLPAGREHPLLAERVQRHLAARASREASWTPIGRDRWSLEEKRSRESAYWQETRHIWVERLAVFACGRRVKMLGAFDG